MAQCSKCGEEMGQGAVCPSCNHVREVSSLVGIKTDLGGQSAVSVGVGASTKVSLEGVALHRSVTSGLGGGAGLSDFEVVRLIEGPFALPMCMACRGDRILVVDLEDEALRLFEVVGDEVRQLSVVLDASERDIAAMALLPDGRAVLCDRQCHELLVVSATGEITGTIGEEGEGEGEFDGPEGIAVLADGRLIVAEQNNHRLQVLSASGDFEATIGLANEDDPDDFEGDAPGQFSAPVAVASTIDGGFVVLEGGNDRVQRFGPGGEHLGLFGERGSAVGCLSDPRSVGVNRAGYIFVGDRGGRRIQKFDPSGELIYALEVAEPEEMAAGNLVAEHRDELWVTWKKARGIALIRKVV